MAKPVSSDRTNVSGCAARQRDQIKRFSGQGPNNSFGYDLIPKRFGIAVVKNQVAVVQQARHTKFGDRVAYLPTHADGRAAERAPGDRNGLSCNRVINDFVMIANLCRVCAELLAKSNGDDDIVVADVRGVSRRNEFRIVD